MQYQGRFMQYQGSCIGVKRMLLTSAGLATFCLESVAGVVSGVVSLDSSSLPQLLLERVLTTNLLLTDAVALSIRTGDTDSGSPNVSSVNLGGSGGITDIPEN